MRWAHDKCCGGMSRGVRLSTPVELIASHRSQMSYENIWWNGRGGEKGVGVSLKAHT